MEGGSRLASRIEAFVEHAEALWQDYKSLGPGKLDRCSWDGVAAAASEIESTIGDPDVARWLKQLDRGTALCDELQAEVKQLSRLARACACTPQGLSFITGEAGLIPRRDQHQAVESGLLKLRDMASQLR